MAWLSWEKEKAYCQRRAKELFAAMDKAIENRDVTAFSEVHRKIIRYATKREIAPYYKRFLKTMNEK